MKKCYSVVQFLEHAFVYSVLRAKSGLLNVTNCFQDTCIPNHVKTEGIHVSTDCLSTHNFKGHKSPEKTCWYIDVSLERIATSMIMILFCRLFLHSLVQLDFSLWSGKYEELQGRDMLLLQVNVPFKVTVNIYFTY